MPPALSISRDLVKPLLCAVIFQLAMLALTGLMADGGVMLNRVIDSVWTFCTVTLLIAICRPRTPTQGDLFFVTWGFLPIAFIYILVGDRIYESVQLLLQR